MDRKKLIPLALVVTVLVAATLYFEVFRRFGGDRNRIEGSGTVEVTEIEISSKIAGRVASLPRPEGSPIAEGELAAKLEYEELSAQQLSARASLVNAGKNLERVRELYATGSVSKKDFDNAETAYRVARAAYDGVNAAISYAVIYSPISGTVLDTNLEVGEMAFPGTPILTVADLTRPWMYVYIDEKRLGLVKLGQSARVFVDSFPARAFEGKVVSISNKAEFTPKTIQTKEERVKLVFAVKIAIKNPDGSLKP
jgi:HlyD family secretion protein